MPTVTRWRAQARAHVRADLPTPFEELTDARRKRQIADLLGPQEGDRLSQVGHFRPQRISRRIHAPQHAGAQVHVDLHDLFQLLRARVRVVCDFDHPGRNVRQRGDPLDPTGHFGQRRKSAAYVLEVNGQHLSSPSNGLSPGAPLRTRLPQSARGQAFEEPATDEHSPPSGQPLGGETGDARGEKGLPRRRAQFDRKGIEVRFPVQEEENPPAEMS